MACCKALLKLGFYCLCINAVLFVFVTYFVNTPPSHKFSAYKIDPVKAEYENPVDHCISINGAEKLLENKIHGPEVFKIINGELYTGLASGEVVKVTSSGVVALIAKIGGKCEGYWEEAKCGRPLSIEYCAKENKLYILDTYHGIWKMDLDGRNKQLLVSPRVAVGGEIPKFLNSMVLDDNGDIYWTDSSVDYDLQDGMFTTMLNPSGRLMHYKRSSNSSTKLVGKLGFANGVAISPNKEFVIVAETLTQRITKYYIAGSKKGQSEVFVTGLPGYPDNIQVLPDGSGILVGQYAVFDAKHPCLTKTLAGFPLLRQFIVRLFTLIKLPVEYVNTNLFPHVLFDKLLFHLGNFKLASKTLSKLTGFMHIDWNGNIVNCYINSDGSLSTISDAIAYNQKLYLGSPHNDYIGAIPIPKDLVKAFAPKAKEQAKIEKPVEKKPTPKPVETKPPAPKPTEAKPQAPKPTETKKQAKPDDSKQQASKPVETKKQTPKPSESKAQAPKPVETKTEPPKAAKIEKKPELQKPTKEQIPIKEEIPSDTAKPPKETLKVIKKSGPAEIPNPNV